MRYIPISDFSPDEILEYLRKSRTDDPLLDVAEVLEKHETILDEWAEKNLGDKIPEENKFREVVSGETIDSRPELLKILKKIESPKIKALLIVEVQRLGRPDLEDIGRLSKLFRYTNTMVITPNRTFDLRDEYDREAFERELMRGNEYLEYTKKIMNRGRLLSVQQGNFIGNKAPYGYNKVAIMDGKKKCHTLEINPVEAEVVQMIFDMYVNEDLGRTTICRRLNEMGAPSRHGGLWTKDSVKYIIENEHYLGKVRWNWRKSTKVVEDGEIKNLRTTAKVGEYLVFEGRHPAIISEELFERARAKRSKNPPTKIKNKVINAFAGILYCQCGRMMAKSTYKNPKHMSQPRLVCPNQPYCKTSSALYSEVMNQVKDTLKECVREFEQRIENDDKDARKSYENQIKRLKTRLEELNKKELSQWEKYSEEQMPKEIFEQLNAKVLKEKDEIQEELCMAYASLPEPFDYEQQLADLRAAVAAMEDPTVSAEKLNKVLKACIERIDYDRKKAERIPSQQTRYYDQELKQTRYTSPLKTGANWTNNPPELNVTLKVLEKKKG